MIQTKDYTIQGCDDAELGIKRGSALKFKLTYDDEKDVKAIVCIIPGLGGDANSSYKDNLAQSIAKELSVAVLSVDYFFINCSTDIGATHILDDIDKLIFRTMTGRIGFELDADFDILVDDREYFDNLLGKLNLHMGLLKIKNRLAMDARIDLRLSLISPNGDYQNFGVMSASDVINAILYVRKNTPFNNGGGVYALYISRL